MDIVIECNCVIFRWLLLNSKCAKSIFENLVNRHLMIFTHSHSKSRTPILKVAIYIGAHLGPILRVAPILKVQFPTQGCIYSQPKRSQPPSLYRAFSEFPSTEPLFCPFSPCRDDATFIVLNMICN